MNVCGRAALAARDCILSAETVADHLPAPGLDRSGELRAPALGYHIAAPLALARIIRRSMPVYYHPTKTQDASLETSNYLIDFYLLVSSVKVM